MVAGTCYQLGKLHEREQFHYAHVATLREGQNVSQLDICGRFGNFLSVDTQVPCPHCPRCQIAGLEKPRMPQPFVYAQLINQFGHAKFYPSAPLKRRQTDCPDRSVGFSLERPQIALARRYDGTYPFRVCGLYLD